MKNAISIFAGALAIAMALPATARVATYQHERGVAVGPNGGVVAGSRTTVNTRGTVNRNVNNVTVVGGGPRVVVHDDGYSGAAVAGAAIAGAAVGAAVASSHNTTVVVAPGTVVTALPATSCSGLQVNGMSYYNCSGTYYRPYFRGNTLVYEVVVRP